MRLELGKTRVDNVEFSKNTTLIDRTLFINKEELTNVLLEKDRNIKQIDIELARPGESVRIIPVKDVVEPRVKIAGGGDLYPGYVGGVKTVGEGVTHILDGCTVMATGRKIHLSEGLLDMSGPGAYYTTLAKLNNVVILITAIDNLDDDKYEQTVRATSLRAADYLGRTAASVKPDESEVFEFNPVTEAIQKYPHLPRIVYVCQLALHRTVYGLDIRGMLPIIISPLEVIDGALVGSVFPSACHRNTTYHLTRNPVILELLRRHGKELCFIGVILTNELPTLAGKERSSFYAAQVAKIIGAQGAIITEDGAGNPDTDLMLNCRNLEKYGIKTVLVTDELAGQDGVSPGLVDAVQEASAMVSTGNANEVIDLPAMDRVIGSLEEVGNLAGGSKSSLHDDGAITIETTMIIGALCELGFERITTKLR